MTKDLAHPDRPRSGVDDHRAVLRGGARESRNRWRDGPSWPTLAIRESGVSRASPARRAGERTCSAGSRARHRAGMRRSSGNAVEQLRATSGGSSIGFVPASSGVDDRDPATSFCSPWVNLHRAACRAVVNLVEQRIGVLPRRQRCGEDIGRRDRILDRRLMPTPADRRHRMRRVADHEQARPVPLLEPVDRHGQQLDVVPARHASRSTVAVSGPTARTRSRNASSPFAADPLGRALGEHERALTIIAAVDQHEQQCRCRTRPCVSFSGCAALGTRNQNTSIGAPISSTAARRDAANRARRRRSSAARGLPRPRRSARRRPGRPSSIRSAPSQLWRNVEGRIAPRRIGDEIEEIPLRHQRDERRAAPADALKSTICMSRPAIRAPQLADLLVRPLEQCVEQAEFVEDAQASRDAPCRRENRAGNRRAFRAPPSSTRRARTAGRPPSRPGRRR